MIRIKGKLNQMKRKLSKNSKLQTVRKRYTVNVETRDRLGTLRREKYGKRCIGKPHFSNKQKVEQHIPLPHDSEDQLLAKT